MFELDNLVIVIASLLASTISAITSMGGGIIVLAVMYSTMSNVLLALTLHSWFGLSSNISRAIALRKDVQHRKVALFVLGGIPSSIVTVFLFNHLIATIDWFEDGFKMAIGLYILSTLRKKKHTENDNQTTNYWKLGMFAMPVSVSFGANGALIGKKIAQDISCKRQIVATSSYCQLMGHIFKIVVFYLLYKTNTINSYTVYDDFSTYLPIIVAMFLFSLVGTYLGRSLLDRVNKSLFDKIFKSSILISSLMIIFGSMSRMI
ncbi:TSUP family transporter [Vibrio sp. WXL103]|uniref:TSUP family transporter n=1 Tax=unclassified Vibrio TaxID=2614977 RepID=UPI003EC7738F